MRILDILGKSVFSIGLVVGLNACTGGGDTDGGPAGDQNFEGTQFVPTDDAAGSIRVEVNNDRLQIGETSGFFVTVRDANGGPVPGLRISCDSEAGVAILEPNTGREITDSEGTVSGVLGCEQPGSFQFGCRLPAGANKRQLVRIICEGEAAGFGGFPGPVAGGGLGGGVGENEEGTEGVRVVGASAIDVGQTTFQVDTGFGTCGTAPDVTAEPFSDTFLQVSIVNNTGSRIRFDRLSYTVPQSDSTGRTFQSSQLAFISEVVAEQDGGEATGQVLAFSVHPTLGQADTHDKYFVNSSTGNVGISTALGFRSVRITITGTNAQGEAVTATGSITLSFGNYDRCSS
ncbi:MAG: hypothetical protein J5J00_00335 [Deltaproteobacteria bacterium]|nr:hypothetical protein [Deltaproteobacteria bacterium]